MNSWYHAKSSAKKWGGSPTDYIEIHEFIDSSKKIIGDVRHRSLYHHTEGIWLCQRIFGRTITVDGPPLGGVLYIPEELDLPDEELDDNDAFTAKIIESMKKAIKNPQKSYPVLPSPIVVRSEEEAKKLLQARPREVPVRLIAELHVEQDLGWIPSPKDYIDGMVLKKWMGGLVRKEVGLDTILPKDDHCRHGRPECQCQERGK